MADTPSSAVFLSYASQDAEAARRIAEALRAAGVEVWFDQNELVGGDAWDAKIRGQIASCALFVPVISAATQARLEGYFRIEWKLAAQRTHAMAEEKAFLLPVVIDDTRDAEAKVPAEFKTVQWTKLPGSETPEKFCARVGTLLAGRAEVTSAEAKAEPKLKRRPAAAPARRTGWIVGALVAGCGLMLSLWYLFWNPRGVRSAAGDRVVLPESGRAAEVRALEAKVEEFLRNPNLLRPELETAELLCKQATELAATDAPIWALSSRVSTYFLALGFELTAARRQSARDAAARAMALDGRSTKARFAQAFYWARGERAGSGEPPNVDAARQIFDELLRERPDDPQVMLEWARLRPFAEAKMVYDKVANDPLFGTHALIDLGWACYFTQRYEEAERVIDRAIARQKTWGNLGLKVYLAMFWRGDLAMARTVLAEMPAAALQEDWSVVLAFWLADWSGDPEGMLRALRATTRDWVSSMQIEAPKAWLQGFARDAGGQHEAAQSDFRRALDLIEQRLAATPNQGDLLALKAHALWVCGEREKAERSYRMAVELGAKVRTHTVVLFESPESVIDIQEKLLAQGAEMTAAQLRLHPGLRGVRNHPRFQALLARVEADPARSPKATPARPAPEPGDKSVAVLAFKNVGSDPANEALVDGIGLELISVLGRVQGLTVRGGSSLEFSKTTKATAQEKGRQLAATYLVDGSVQRGGDTVRITASVTRAATNEIVWTSAPLNRDVKNFFAVQEEIAGLIAQALSLKLTAGSAASTAAVNPEAMELYLRGRQSWALRTRESMEKAEDLLQRAIALQPDFARAHAGLADVWLVMGEFDGLTRFKNRKSHEWDRILAKLDEVALLDPKSAECFASRGQAANFRWQFAEAEPFFRRALELNPNHATAHQWYARYLSLQGRMDEALGQIEAALTADPFAPRIASNAAMIHVLAGRPARGLELAERSLALQSGNSQAIMWKAEALVALGRSNDLEQFIHTLAGGAGAPVGPMGATFLAQVGRLDRPSAETPVRGFETGGYVDTATYNLTRSKLIFGRKAEALAGLVPEETSYANCEWMAYLPLFDQIRSEPAFRRFYDEVGLGEAHARAQAWRKAHPPEKPVAK